MLSSLSRVPPVWPRARPEIMGTNRPAAATIGATRKEVLSPTPPVECLSTRAAPRLWKSSTPPESRMWVVRLCSSSGLRPRQKMAMSHAESWYSGMEFVAAPATKNPISASVKAPPSRFLRIRSTTCMQQILPAVMVIAPGRHPRRIRNYRAFIWREMQAGKGHYHLLLLQVGGLLLKDSGGFL